ncbi:MAG: InlB B-repeat-containing protein, partial [Bacilli bacterium]|nr:InlB B-repeat-containing protein [Bacilli bacterium]
MLDLKNRKYKILLHIVIIISLMILMISFARLDKYKGKITFNNISSEKKVLSSVGDTLFASSRGYDEVEYKVNYTLDEIEGITKRDVIIRGKIDELDSKYAYFKEIHKNNITSTLNNNGREIEVRIKNVTLGEEHSINLKIVIEGAPNGKRITPEIYIKESTGEETKINTDSILVETRSVEGIVTDEDDLELNTIELSLYKNDEEIRRTFTDERGRFVFTDLEDGEYTIHIEEDNYEMDNDITINDETTVEIKLRKVDKYNVVINKYIDKVNLIVNGKEYNYTYNDVSKVVQNVEKAKSVSGEIEYKIVVENNSNKLSEISKVIDEPSEGLIFNKDKNTGWEEINDILVYRPMSSITLNPYEKREIKLVLDIENTKNAKNYFNKATSKGEIKEKVTYLLNNEVIKEETVIEGDTIKEPSLNIENFDGWYTDKNYTNKYDFKNEVNKDLILYGRTRIILINHIVTFMSDEEIFYKDLEVLDMTSIEEPIDNPTKEHYVFKKWVTENNEEFDFNTLITEDTTLYAVFEKVEEPTINISPSTWTKENVTVSLTNSNSDYSFMYKIDNGNYSLYTGEFTVNKNSTIYSYSIYNDVASEETSLEITNIDKINPILNNLNIETLTPVQAEISFNLKENESGIKKYNVYLNNELIYESDEYTNLVNEEKEENYIVSGLEELSTYTIKVEAVDKTGNTSSDEISISTPAKVYVCQIESVNGTDLNEPIKLESLTEAIEYNNSGINCLTNTCEIKMLLDIEESSTILNGQDIILNLNGKYISGTNDSTITNNG